jgi:hypothetical protein
LRVFVFNRGEKVKDSRSYLDLFQRRVNAKESNYNAHLKATLVLVPLNNNTIRQINPERLEWCKIYAHSINSSGGFKVP